MDTPFKHTLALLTHTGACSPKIHGLIRKDETAAIFSPQYERELKDAYKVRHYRNALDVRDYIIEEYHRDIQRPLSKWLIKPIVCKLSTSYEQAAE